MFHEIKDVTVWESHNGARREERTSPHICIGRSRCQAATVWGGRAMWSERSRHMRGGAVLGSREEKVGGLAGRFLARDMRLSTYL